MRYDPSIDKRYEARINEDDTWRIIDNLLVRSPAYYATKAEAELLVFVLNAWSSGHNIVAIDPIKAFHELAVTHDGWNFYEGPEL